MPRWLLCIGICVLLVSTYALDEIVNNSLSEGEQETEKEKQTGTETDIKLPSEVQRAVCTVNAGEVKASAEAVTTKTLKGVCGSDEMNLAFRNLEQKLFEELREVKDQLIKLTAMLEQPNQATRTLTPTASTTPFTPSTSTMASTPEPFIRPSNMKIIKFEQITLKPSLEKKQPELKQMEGVPEREEEIDRFNNTMLADQDFQLFTYYWKLENITEHIAKASTRTVKSKTLQLQCTFQHLHRDMINLQLAMAYPTYENGVKGKENNIMLDMGGQWKPLKWADRIAFKHKISLLDQQRSHRRPQDLSSLELTKLDSGFSIPNSAILGSNYVKHNSLLIQIILYL
ncbi:hypothetical protein AWZ03_011449 [Drosophila navojoa]|uniref:Fibrinogen C-terminal domain-containing protein n=1 Tax=Drosophila navojoa TaxID=7232 RepID=A0A484AZR9_DRONA|nr:hypothetical protein AWZ03_011449 [Drosophila navojoa]